MYCERRPMIQRFTITQNIFLIPHKLTLYIFIRTHFLACENGPCIKAVFVKPRYKYWQITTVKVALQNKPSSYLFQIITQESFPRTSIIFNILLQTHGSLCWYRIIDSKSSIFNPPHLMSFIKVNCFIFALCVMSWFYSNGLFYFPALRSIRQIYSQNLPVSPQINLFYTH